jgi:hypothetical protein
LITEISTLPIEPPSRVSSPLTSRSFEKKLIVSSILNAGPLKKIWALGGELGGELLNESPLVREQRRRLGLHIYGTAHLDHEMG